MRPDSNLSQLICDSQAQAQALTRSISELGPPLSTETQQVSHLGFAADVNYEAIPRRLASPFVAQTY